MGGATTAELEERAAGRLELYRKVIYRSFLIAGIVVLLPIVTTLAEAYREDRASLPVAFAGGAGGVLFLWCYARTVDTGLSGRLSRRDTVLSGALTLLLSPMMVVHPLWCLVPLIWAATLTLWVPGRTLKVALCLGVAADCALFVSWYGGPPRWHELLLLFALFTALCASSAYVNYYYRRMWDLHQEADAAREAQARLAVAEERLRFSRDLHDLLGHSLSLIAVKSELAMRMSETDPARAREEMADVRRAAREALREVRTAVRGYRAVELDAELAGVRAVLEAAGVRCEAGAPPEGLPPEVRAVLAWVIREGATNVIKHSEARHCGITIAAYGGSVVLEMSNDGVRAARRDPGSGLAGLAERVEVLGGTLTSGSRGRDRFLLRAVVPLPEEAR
ncbi:hypothetical protein GCM10023085_68440 [Actinomadura viridis]|uniref:Two-component system sensor histidine kinase DesK n=1 Tax=Actinomadura viridis TaxID=58110 RepID=A0A931GIS3_9ACTN|nr:sensor histidine kinase [Actinomadura viridis]MBG6088382.1 two-component system sensor histidine kinase DesK [Actinomadura viridis]